MKNRIKSKTHSLLEARSIIFGAAIFNFILIYVKVQQMEGKFCMICPWYIDWSISNYPSFLLFAAFSLWLNKWWGYALSILFSSSIVYRAATYFIHLILVPDDSWTLLFRIKDFLLLQYILAVTIFLYAVAKLWRVIVYKHFRSAAVSNKPV